MNIHGTLAEKKKNPMSKCTSGVITKPFENILLKKPRYVFKDGKIVNNT